MKPVHSAVVSAAFVLVALAAAVWLYPSLPAQTPTHWDLQGHVNGTMPRLWAAAIPVLLVSFLALLMVVLPKISPRRFEIAPFLRVWHVVMLSVQGLILVIGLCALLKGAGYPLPMATIGMTVVGVMLIIIGNYMGKLQRNFFAGIRTPWTLASEEVWERTHRLAGWVFVLAGLAWIALMLAGVMSTWLLVVLVGVLLVPSVYSYVIYRRLERTHPGQGDSP
ncbi:SdpI family protein [Dyella sp. A6]|uniref:SdpI family protein n=1 Tax=Dyella aluminiiresistens TaxID=3069105 RepID=UPI002E7864FF|nr:SdpI family protein [Dyella sp. A6]